MEGNSPFPLTLSVHSQMRKSQPLPSLGPKPTRGELAAAGTWFSPASPDRDRAGHGQLPGVGTWSGGMQKAKSCNPTLEGSGSPVWRAAGERSSGVRETHRGTQALSHSPSAALHFRGTGTER